MTTPRRSRIVAIVSDIHFDLHDVQAWKSFRQWHRAIRPHTTVVLGDFVDLGMLSRFVQGTNDAMHAIPQIKCFVDEANALKRECTRLVVIEGNHDERWAKALCGAAPWLFRGALGLSLEAQCRSQGLDARAEWRCESARQPSFTVAQFALQHGHKQAGSFGGGVHIAANALNRGLGQSYVRGHHHRGQMFAKSAHGRTAVSIANPCLTIDHDYAPGADWQRGFTVLEAFKRPDGTEHATPHLVLMERGEFAWNGRVYDGKAHR